jgi:hypothetical protein
MIERDLEADEALWTWFKALDAATEAAQAKIKATLASNRADVAGSAERVETESGSQPMGRGLFLMS